MRRIARLVEAVFDVPALEFLADRKGRPLLVQARQLLVYLLVVEAGFEQKAVADRLGRHHSTIAHAIHKIEALREEADFDDALGRVAEMCRVLREGAQRIPPPMQDVPT